MAEAIKQIAKGLKYLHDHDITHRDLSPGNVLVFDDPTNNNIIIKLSDFGLSRYIATSSQHLSAVGTKSYSAPEVQGITKNAILPFKTDIYSLGMIICFLICTDLPLHIDIMEKNISYRDEFENI